MTARRVDANQKRIVAELRQCGATVTSTAGIGHGFPDIAVGFRGRTYLFEVKMPGEGLTPDEQKWHDCWRGQVNIIRRSDDALAVIQADQFDADPNEIW